MNAINGGINLTPQQIAEQQFHDRMKAFAASGKNLKNRKSLITQIGNAGSMLNAWLSDNKDAQSQSNGTGIDYGGTGLQSRSPGMMR